MKSARINYVAVGAFVVIIVVALIAAIAVLSGRHTAVDRYTTVFRDVAGLKQGAEVRYGGHSIGRVTDIEPKRRDHEMVFHVKLSIEEGWPIPIDSVARPSPTGLLSGVAVQIERGQKKELLDPGGKIAGKPSVDLMATLKEVAERAPQILTNLRTVTGELRQHAPSLIKDANAVTDNLKSGSRELRRALSAENRKKISDALSHLIKDANAVTDNLKSGSRELRRALSTDNRKKVSDALSHLRRVSAGAADLAEQLKETRKQLDTLLGDVNATVDGARPKIRDSLRYLERTLATLARSIHTLTHNMQGTSRNMEEFSRRIRENPGLLLFGSERPPAPPAQEQQ